jgi:hypothetical protein
MATLQNYDRIPSCAPEKKTFPEMNAFGHITCTMQGIEHPKSFFRKHMKITI